MSPNHIFTYTQDDPYFGFFGIKEVDDKVVVALSGSGYAGADNNERTMVIPTEYLLPLAHSLIRYVTHKGIKDGR